MNWKLLGLVFGSIAVLVIALAVAKINPVDAASTLLKGSLGTPAAISGTLKEMTPLLILGLSVYLALRVGLFNIGAEGQFVVGALACTTVALRVPGVPGMALGTLAAILAGALWALPAGLIKGFRGGHEVITTIMLNNIAVQFSAYLAAGPLKDPTQQSPTTSTLSAGSRLPFLYDHPPVQVSGALVLGLVLALVLAWWLRRTVAGFEFEAVGANPKAARFAGIEPRKMIVWGMVASGAIAGLGGAMQVLAYEGRFYDGFSPGYGFDALGVALLAGNSALGVLPASALFGILAKGGVALQINQVPKGITTVVLGLIIVVAAAIRYRRPKTVA